MASNAGHPKIPPSEIKKRSTFGTLFSIFRSSKYEDQHVYPSKMGLKARVAPSLSATSLPTSSAVPESQGSKFADSSNIILSTVSLPAQIRPPFSHSPSSSSSSASSFELGSEASTPTTTPSNSSPSILMKVSDPIQPNSFDTSREVSIQIPNSLKKAKRSTESYRKSPSPLSTVTDVHHTPHILPAQPQSPVLHERPNSFQPKRRNSIGRLLLRRSCSNPDLTQASEVVPPIPAIPQSAPSSRPTSSQSNSPSRSRTLRRKTGTADIEKPTAYSRQEKIEHKSILGADPAGLGYYLYPKSDVENPKNLGRPNIRPPGTRRSWNPDDFKQNNWLDGNTYIPGTPRKIWREPRGRDFRGTVASQVIVEEGNDTYESSTKNPNRRSSEALVKLRQPKINKNTIPPLAINYSRPSYFPSIDSRLDILSLNQAEPMKGSCPSSLHNNWAHISPSVQPRSDHIPNLQIPSRRSRDLAYLELEEEVALRRLQASATKFMSRPDGVTVTENIEGLAVENQIADKLSQMQIPVIRVEMVDV